MMAWTIGIALLVLSSLAHTHAGYINISEGRVRVSCEGNDTLDTLPEPYRSPSAGAVREFSIEFCPLPTTTYIEWLQGLQINICRPLQRATIKMKEKSWIVPMSKLAGLETELLELKLDRTFNCAIKSFDSNGNYNLLEAVLQIDCQDNSLESVSLLPPARYKEINITNCRPPRDTYAKRLSALGVEVAALQILRVHYTVNDGRPPPQPKEEEFVGLTLKELNIIVGYNDYEDPENQVISFVINDFNSTEKADLTHINKVTVVCEIRFYFILTILPGQYDEVEFTRCAPPSSYASGLQVMGVNTTSLKSLRVFLEMDAVWNWEHFSDLTLNKLEISFYERSFIGCEDYGKCDPRRTTYIIYNYNSTEYPTLARVDELYMRCGDEELERPQIQERNLAAKTVKMFNCRPPFSGLKSLYVQVPAIERLDIINAPLIKTSDLANFTVSSLSIYGSDVDNIYGSFNDSETSQLYPLPDDSKVLNLVLMDGESMSEIGGCGELRRLELVRWQIPELDGNFLAHCSKLEELILRNLKEKTVQRALAGLRSLTSLSIHQSKITHQIDQLLHEAVNLRFLNLSDNNLVTLYGSTFEKQTALVVLDLSNNPQLSSFTVRRSLRSLPTPPRIYLNGINATNFCDIKWSIKVKKLFLKNSSLKSMCFSSLHHLNTLDLAGNNITELKLDELPSRSVMELKVDLTGNPIGTWPNTEEEYNSAVARFSKANNVTILVDNTTLECDGEHAWFARTLQALPQLKILGVTCNKAPTHTAMISVRSRPLLITDLKSGHASSLDVKTLQELFATPGLRLLVDGNTTRCDCDILQLLQLLRAHHEQVDNYSDIVCDDGQYLRNKLEVLQCTAYRKGDLRNIINKKLISKLTKAVKSL